LSNATKIIATAIADEHGRFGFDDVPPGVYEIAATLQGFINATERVVIVEGGLVQQLELRLSVGGITETVTVTGESPLIQVARSTTSGRQKTEKFSTAVYDPITDNNFKRVADAPLSTFSVDVDTASYANVRRFLNRGTLPPADAVRIEEMINYFHFDYPDASDGRPLSVTTELAPCPWNDRHALALIGLQTRRVDMARTPPRNLVFLLDVSGSMEPADRLPLVQSAMLLLTESLRAEDSVAIVVYAGASGLALPATSGSRKADIQQAITSLRAGGSTNGAAGIQLAYQIASEHFVKDGINRVILATDGDFNVGVSSPGALARLIESKRKTGVFLSVLGVGDDNYKDATMEKLADLGNGNYAYLDSLDEARRVLVDEASATLIAVAKDVKLQVEFNPRHVDGYRLIGYEDRVLANEDFKDDRKDAGDMGAGHSVTALYEIVPSGRGRDLLALDPLRYQRAPSPTRDHRDEMMNVKVRYKAVDGERSTPFEVPVRASKEPCTDNLRFAAAVAEFGMLLRDSPHKGGSSWAQVSELASASRGSDPGGYRAEFLRLAELAALLQRQQAPAQ
jgi:Ca-activated chloride channel family protein